MVRYSYTKVVNCDKLDAELRASGLPYSFLELNKPDDLRIWMSVELNVQQEQSLTELVMTHVTVDLRAIVAAKITKAMSFGRDLIADYGATNVIAGYSIEQIQEIMDRTAKVQVALNTGSLYVALAELANIETDEVLITEEKIQYFRHKIQDYLQIPRT